VGAGNSVTLCDLRIFLDQASEPVPSQNAHLGYFDAAETGETLTEAVVIALRERLDREHAKHGASMRMRLARLASDVATLPVADGRTPEDIIGYDDADLPS